MPDEILPQTVPAANAPEAAPVSDTANNETDDELETGTDDKPMLSDEEILKIIVDPLSEVSDHWKPYQDKYKRLENLYFGNIREDSPAKTMQSQYSSGDAFELVETILPRLISNKMGCDMVGVEESDNEPARIVEQIMDWQIETQWLEQPLENWIRQCVKTVGALLVDSEVVDVKHYKKKRKYTMTLPLVGKEIGVGPLVETVETKQIFKHILEVISYEDLVVPPGTSNDTLPFIGRKTSKKVYAMKQDDRYRKDAVNKLAASIGEYVKSNPDEYKQARADQQDLTDLDIDKIALETEADLLELYFVYEDTLYRVDMTPDDHTIVRAEVMDNWHKMLPIRLLSLIPVENQAIGQSPLEAAEGQLDAEDTWINIVLETALFDVMRPTAYDKNALGVNYRKNPPVYKPGMNLPVKGDPARAFAVLSAPKIDGSHQWLTSYFRQRLQNKLGVTDYISGADQNAGNKTKYEIQVKTAQSNKRFALNIKHLRREMSKVFFMMSSNLQQYMPDNYPVRVLGKRGYQWKKIKSESIQGRFDFRVRGFESIATEEAETIGKYRAMLTDAMNPLVRQFVNVYEVVKGLFVDGYKVDANSKILITPQELMEQQDKDKQAQAADANSENMDPRTAVVRPDDDHAVHLDIHMAFIKSPMFQQLPPEMQLVLARHVDAHRKVLAQGSGQPGAPATPAGEGSLQPTPPVSSLIPPSERDFNQG